ncbi:tyrosine-type recombinase/integrase [Nitrosomonas nitrosa]|uniref:tyrosine-type recombinase/integrase n=1 Tax=Nitrosomonas nitrosa TaxID=52442 RepID=UPI0023F66A64|nr:site-specific integrase [Nitrosomonas nitrosa]MCO6433954.1 site-specific integrase [Nitrosomonas nitrosa]
MRLVLATADLVVEGRSFEGFPLLLNNDGWPLEPAQSFLWHTLVTNGGIESKLTWEAYGRRLYDYFSFLTANGLVWNEAQKSIGLSVVAKYRDWSLGELGLNPSTVNRRLNLVVRFYDWCKRQGHISHLPFSMRDVRLLPHQGFLAHVNRLGCVVSKPTVIAREHKPTLKFLIKEQVRLCLGAKLDPSHALLLNLMVRTGMRSCEARTFPLTYVFNPRTRKGLMPGQMIRVNLEPTDMHIKYGKPRSVDVPWSLMEDMWIYSLHQREIRRKRSGLAPCALVLTALGTEFSKGAVVDAMKAIEKKVGFPVRAHMLRHSYGTYTLSALRKNISFEGEPLLYVRDRMGHLSVQTTAIYLHLINQLDAQLVLAHEDEIDMLFTRGSNGSIDTGGD